MSVFRQDLVRDQVALVTGGGTGIGKGIARSLAEHGAKLAIASRSMDNLMPTRDALESDGFECIAVPCDIREPDQVERVMQEILKHYGKLDILVNNAAGNFPAPIAGLSYNGFKSVVSIDLLGTYNVSKAAYDAYLGEHGGHVVNITAPYHGMGVALQSHAASAKMGIDALTRTAAVEWGPKGIRVNGIAPGAVSGTEGLARLGDIGGGSNDAEQHANNPLGFVGNPTDIANALLFLVSDAARYVTGQILNVDAGSSVDMLKVRLD